MKNPITIKELQQLLNNEETSAEAFEFYFEYYSTGPFAGQYRLKSKISIVENYNRGITESSEGVSSFLMETFLNDANRIARRKRKKLFDERKNDPDRLILVSEGDSWFQFPKYKKIGITFNKEVKDIIDYLIEDSRFAVMSLDAGGDIIRNMFHTSEFLEAITTHNPKIFLFSGGGNDFFEVFPKMIKKGDSNDISSFLKETWRTELEVIKTYYKGTLDILTTQFPELPIILHGYDYVIPRPNGKWLGQPMIEKGELNSGEDRKKLIRFTLDQFNETILKVSAPYTNVHFIDLRNTVPQDLRFWHDEIHPNDHGFKMVAGKFITKIKELTNRPAA